jgi:ribonucleoside-diphosphate reductase alpha chain
MELGRNAEFILRERYLRRDKLGNIEETPADMARRVARCAASQEPVKKRSYWTKEFFRIISTLNFLPNSPTLMNAGKKEGQLSACFVLPLTGGSGRIFETLRSAVLIQESGGGTGFSFDGVRSGLGAVGFSRDESIGPVDYLRVFDAVTDLTRQGGVRRGANMAVLSDKHPDLMKFINAKTSDGGLRNFNLSVGVSNRFLVSALAREESNEVQHLKAMARAARASGDPGVLFLDRVNLFNPTPTLGKIVATNPCGEQPLLDYESCNLGSMNVFNYVIRSKFNWEAFERDIRVAVRLLDNIVDANVFPVAECLRANQRTRKLGLGVMGFSDAIISLGMNYDSAEAVTFGERLMSFLDRVAKQVSHRLAAEKGVFPAFRGSIWDRLGYPQLRNATVSTVAPTGTLAVIAGVSSGIEPHFSELTRRRALDGSFEIVEVPACIRRVIESPSGAKFLKRVKKYLKSEGKRSVAQLFLRLTRGRWRTAQSIDWKWHIKMQAAFQRHSDSAVSKTVNLAPDVSEKAIAEIFLSAAMEGCKGVTVYRDGSKAKQVLSKGSDAEDVDAVEAALVAPGVCWRC